MDPLHPIVPVQPNIPPVTPAPMAGRIDRDQSRAKAGEEKHRRRRREADGEPSGPGGDRLDYAGEYDAEYAGDLGDGDDDSGLHINVTA